MKVKNKIENTWVMIKSIIFVIHRYIKYLVTK